MILNLFAALVAAYTFSAVGPTTVSESVAALTTRHCFLGERYQFQTAECQFQVHNSGDEPVRVFNLATTNEGDVVTPSELVVQPRSSAEIRFRTNLGDRFGNVIRIVTFNVGGESRKLIARGFVLSDLDDPALRIDFGPVDAEIGSKRKSVTLSSHEVANFRIKRIVETPEWIDARIDEDGVSVSARVKPGAPWSPQEGRIKLAIDAPHQSQAWITVAANLQGAVIPSANPYEMGAVREGSELEFILRLNTRNGQPLKIGSLDSRGVSAKLTQMPCVPENDGCTQVKVSLPAGLPLGIFRGDILVGLPEFNRKLPITFGGLLVAKAATINPAPDRAPTSKAFGAESIPSDPVVRQEALPPKQVDLKSAIRGTLQQAKAEAAPPAGTGPLLTWRVVNEAQVYGYMIYRAESEDGPFVRVNPDVLRVASKGEGSIYQWRDDAAEAGHTYWYYISTINMTGQIKPLSAPQKVQAR